MKGPRLMRVTPRFAVSCTAEMLAGSAALAHELGCWWQTHVSEDRGEIAEVLGLTAKEAEAIVKYRKDTARFEEFDDLGKVSGVDLKKLEKSREAISF